MSVSAETTPSRAKPAPRMDTFEAEPLYGRSFWFAYVANSAVTVGMALMYRYADFVEFLGGTEWNIGWIVGIGMIGSLVMRGFQGFGIDHFGPRRIWLWSNVLFSASLLGHLLVQDPRGPLIFLLRIAYTTSLAGVFGASITSVSRQLPLARMAEVIGTLGTSGFIGMALGPLLGDVFCGGETITRTDLNRMFLVAASLGVVSFVAAELATRREPAPRRRRRPHMLWLLRRYHPGTVLMLGVVLGVGFVIPNTFLPTFIESLGIRNTGTFFLVYSITAFFTRMATRRLPRLIGVPPMIFIGLAALALSLLLYLPVRSEWGLTIPGVFAGIGHAVLFPAVTALGSTSFPARYRGLGTTVMLAMLDTGTLLGAPLVGGLVQFSKSSGFPPYSTTFLVLAGGVVVSGLIYAVSRHGRTA